MLIPLMTPSSTLHNGEHQLAPSDEKLSQVKEPCPQCPRRPEAIATDTVYSDTPAVDSWVKQEQLFVGKDSLVSDIYPMRSGMQFVNTLDDNIHRCGAMDKLISDSANNEMSHKVKDILRAYNISDWQSEPYHHNQHHAIWRYRTIKAWTNTIMNRMVLLPIHCWLLPSNMCVTSLTTSPQHHLVAKFSFRFCMVLPLISASYSYTPFISLSSMLHMTSIFPSDSKERAGYCIGFAEHCGDSMAHMVLDTETFKIIYGSALRPRSPKDPNKRLVDDGWRKIISLTPNPPNIQLQCKMMRSKLNLLPLLSESNQGMMTVQPQKKPFPEFNPNDFVGRTLLLPTNRSLAYPTLLSVSW